MLKTETNTTRMDKRIRAAFGRWRWQQTGRAYPRGWVNTTFEHGQWWITDHNGAQWSVMDAEGGRAVDGFDFERVTEGDEL